MVGVREGFSLKNEILRIQIFSKNFEEKQGTHKKIKFLCMMKTVVITCFFALPTSFRGRGGLYRDVENSTSLFDFLMKPSLNYLILELSSLTLSFKYSIVNSWFSIISSLVLFSSLRSLTISLISYNNEK